MIRVDFDVPSFLRLEKGLCIVSPRLAHMLPEPELELVFEYEEPYEVLEPVVINRFYRPRTTQQVVPYESHEQGDIKGEFIPRDSVPDQEISSAFEIAQGDDDEDDSATELNFQGVAGKSVTGAYAGSGFAPYRFRKSNGNSFYLRIGKHLIWGIELNAQLRVSGAKKSDVISVTFLGKTPVKVIKKVSVNGSDEQEWVDTYRNSWEIKVVR